jgi:hypothetical protein
MLGKLDVAATDDAQFLDDFQRCAIAVSGIRGRLTSELGRTTMESPYGYQPGQSFPCADGKGIACGIADGLKFNFLPAG